MVSLGNYYLPPDRLQALAVGEKLPLTAEGTVLFADISGFTPVTERLRSTFGARRGAEELASHLNRVYDALIAQVDRYGGSIIGFAGDAITCWFSGEATASRATACGFALLGAMRDVEQIMLPEGGHLLLGLKVAITSGTTKRFVAGDPDIQLIDTLAGSVVARMASGEELAERGELLVDAPTAEQLGEATKIREWRGSEPEQFAVLESFETLDIPYASSVETPALPDELLLPWLLPPLARHFQAGLGEFQIELRPVTVLFLRFAGIEYDEDAEAEDKLNQFVRLVQTIVNGYEGSVLQLTIGDKGSYIYAAFGAPFTHEDDSARALNAALDIREQASRLPYLDPLQIGLSKGAMRTGAYGSTTRRTYGVLGDEVNLAARLMARAAPGEILVSETVSGTMRSGFVHEVLTPAVVKGKASPIGLFRLLERRDHTFAERFYTTPMVGREENLATLKNALQPIFGRQHAGVITILGEPGMGKSRLAFEAQQQLQQAEMNVSWFTGQTDALNRSPLSTFAYFLRPYFGQQRDQNRAANLAAFDAAFEGLFALADEANQADLTLYRSFLAGIVNLVIPDSPYETADEKLRIDNNIIALKAWVRAEARRQPLILHLEDAQWLDPSSIRAVQQLTYNLEDVPLALLLTSRYNDDGTPFTIPNIFSVPVHTIDLNQLNSEGVSSVVEAVLQGNISEGLGRFVQQRAEGNPFFTEQVALDLKERGALTVMDGVWDIRRDAAAEVPAGVNAVLIARIDRLTAQVKAVVQTAAVLGREFEVEVLSRMLREADTSALREAEREAIWSSLDEIRYLFRHALLRDAAYEMQAQERLKALHRLAAETIEMLHPGDDTQADVLLEHWYGAGDLDRELPYMDAVVNRFLGVDARYAEAEQLVNRALQRLNTDDGRRVKLLNWLGGAFHARGSFDAASEHARQAQQLAERANDREGLASSLSLLGMTFWSQSSYAEAHACHKHSLTIWQEIGNREGEANSLRELGNVALQLGNYAEGWDYLQEALEIQRQLGNRRGIGRCLQAMGMIAQSQGRFEEARDLWLQSLNLSREIADRASIVSNLTNLGVIAVDVGLPGEAQPYFEQALALAREIGNRRSMAIALANLGNIGMETGAFQEAHAYYEEALALFRQMNMQNFVAQALMLKGVLFIFAANYDEARGFFEQSLPIQQQIGDRFGIATSLSYMGIMAFHQGDYRSAESYLQQALTIRQEIQDNLLQSSLEWLARTRLRLGQIDSARTTLRDALTIAKSLLARQQLEVLVAAVEWHITISHHEAGIELLGLILQHPQTDMETRINARDLLELTRSHLDASTLEAALEGGKMLNMDDVIANLLAELD